MRFVRDAEDEVHLRLIVDADQIGSHRLALNTRCRLAPLVRGAGHVIAAAVVVVPVRRARHAWKISQQNSSNVSLVQWLQGYKCDATAI